MRKISSYACKAEKKQEREFQTMLVTHSFTDRLNERTVQFLDDELADETIEDLDLY
jgi:hypothetical protein